MMKATCLGLCPHCNVRAAKDLHHRPTTVVALSCDFLCISSIPTRARSLLMHNTCTTSFTRLFKPQQPPRAAQLALRSSIATVARRHGRRPACLLAAARPRRRRGLNDFIDEPARPPSMTDQRRHSTAHTHNNRLFIRQTKETRTATLVPIPPKSSNQQGDGLDTTSTTPIRTIDTTIW